LETISRGVLLKVEHPPETIAHVINTRIVTRIAYLLKS